VAPIGLAVLTVVLTYGTIAVFEWVDRTGRPRWLARRKLQQPYVDPARPSAAEALRVHLVNHGLLALGLVALAGALWLRGWSPADPTPAWWMVLGQLLLMGLITEVAFYSAHRWLHTRWLYRRVHRVHHRYRAPTAWSAQFAHPFEYVVGNMLPIALPMVLVAPDLLTLWAFGAVVLLNTQLVHSGYQLPLAPWAVPHDLHHYRVTVNYGSTGLMDRLLGTRLRHPDGQVPSRAPRATSGGRMEPAEAVDSGEAARG